MFELLCFSPIISVMDIIRIACVCVYGENAEHIKIKLWGNCDKMMAMLWKIFIAIETKRTIPQYRSMLMAMHTEPIFKYIFPFDSGQCVGWSFFCGVLWSCCRQYENSISWHFFLGLFCLVQFIRWFCFVVVFDTVVVIVNIEGRKKILKIKRDADICVWNSNIFFFCFDKRWQT